MVTDKINYKINYSKSSGCILINPKKWEENTANIVQGYTVDGTVAINHFTRVLKVNIEEEVFGTPLNENDLVVLTRTASKVSYLKPYKIPVKLNSENYSNVHVLQVIGKFKDNIMSLDNLEVLFDKVVMEKVEVPINNVIFVGEPETTSVGKVVKVGDGGFTSKWKRRPMDINVGDYVLLRDNITTDIVLDNKDYICTEDSMVVGKFKDNIIDINNLEMFHEGILTEEKQEEKIMGSSILFNPSINLEEEDISEVYQRDRFKVIKKSNRIKDVNINDVLIINRDSTNYVIFKGKTYFIINGIKSIEGIAL